MFENESDQQLMERMAGGNAHALDAVVGRHQHRVQRFASRMLSGDFASASDITVGAFLRLWETRANFRPTGSVQSWLLKATYRMCLDHLARPGHRDQSSLPDEGDLEHGHQESLADQIERATLSEAVRTAVSELPETHRAVLILTVYEEMSYEATAEALAIPIGTVASRKNHAVAQLRRRLCAWKT